MANLRDLLLFTGPAGAGKTTVAVEWARTRPYQCAHVSIDDLRYMVKSGFADPQDGWGQEPAKQLDLARGSAAMLASRFFDAGAGCVIDDAIFPDGQSGPREAHYEEWVRELEGRCSHRLVVLLPTLATCLQRNSDRTEHGLSAPDIEIIYQQMVPWRDRNDIVVLDNSSLSVEETISTIEVALEGAAA